MRIGIEGFSMHNNIKHKVTIDGDAYTVVGKYSTDHINVVVDIVNQQMRQLAEIDPTLSVKDRAILMAINAVSDQIVKENKILSLEEKINHLTFEQTSLFNQD